MGVLGKVSKDCFYRICCCFSFGNCCVVFAHAGNQSTN